MASHRIQSARTESAQAGRFDRGSARWPLALSAMALVAMIALPLRVSAQADLLQKAVNYVFTGKVDPDPGFEIVDRASCTVMALDPKNKRYVRYRLKNFQMDDALFVKKYSGRRVYYELQVKGDDYVVEYLSLDRQTVTQKYRSAQIPLPGDIDQTNKALQIIFSDYCKTQDNSGEPF